MVLLLLIGQLQVTQSVSSYLLVARNFSADIIERSADGFLLNRDDPELGIDGINTGELDVWLEPNVIGLSPIYEPHYANISAKKKGKHVVSDAEIIITGLNKENPSRVNFVAAELGKLLSIKGTCALRKADATLLGLELGDKIHVSAYANSGNAQSLTPLIVSAIIDEQAYFDTPRLYISDVTESLLPTEVIEFKQINAFGINIIPNTNITETITNLQSLFDERAHNLLAISSLDYIQNTKDTKLIEAPGARHLKNTFLMTTGTVLLMITLIMRTNFFNQIKEFACLNAIGLSIRRLAVLLWLQGILIGCISGIISISIVLAIESYTHYSGIQIAMNLNVILVVAGLFIVLSSIASVIASLVMRKIEIMSLLR